LDFIAIAKDFGIPVVVAAAFGYFIWKQNKYIQDDLTKDLHNKFNRLEGIIIKLIDQQKKIQIENRGLQKQYEALVHIIAKLSGNGLKDKIENRRKNNGR
jgi:hypothetical protein